jgi:predicted aspartyl protease
MLLLAASAAASPPPIDYEVASSENAVELPRNSSPLLLAGDGFDRLTVPVRLGGSGPFQFLVDTGSDRTSVSQELVQLLGLAERDRALMHSASGPSTVRIAFLPELRAGRRTVRRIRAPMLAAVDIGADGILGIDSLRSQRVVFDFREGSLAIEPDEAADPLDPNAILVRARRKGGRLIITEAEVDGVPVRVVLDSGSSLTVGNSALRRRLERRGGPALIGPIDLVSVTGKALRGELARVGRLDIGGARLEGLAVVFADAHTFRTLDLDRRPAVLLGMNALRAFDQVSIDFAAKRVALVVPRERRLPGR